MWRVGPVNPTYPQKVEEEASTSRGVKQRFDYLLDAVDEIETESTIAFLMYRNNTKEALISKINNSFLSFSGNTLTPEEMEVKHNFSKRFYSQKVETIPYYRYIKETPEGCRVEELQNQIIKLLDKFFENDDSFQQKINEIKGIIENQLGKPLSKNQIYKGMIIHAESESTHPFILLEGQNNTSETIKKVAEKSIAEYDESFKEREILVQEKERDPILKKRFKAITTRIDRTKDFKTIKYNDLQIANAITYWLKTHNPEGNHRISLTGEDWTQETTNRFALLTMNYHKSYRYDRP